MKDQLIKIITICKNVNENLYNLLPVLYKEHAYCQ